MSLESAQVAMRVAVLSLGITGAGLAGLALDEKYVGEAMIPVKGDKWTKGYGMTTGVKKGDRTTPERALMDLLNQVENVYGRGIKGCIKVPLHQWEYDGFLRLAYNVGVPTFCRKAPPGEPPYLIDLINAGRYSEACARIEAFNHGPSPGVDKKGERIKGPVLKGLVKRRAEERAICEGKRR
jgi:lysozyme